MNYSNEYVTDADVTKYDLNQAWNAYHPFNLLPRPGFQLAWTVDRQNDSFLVRVWTGREEQARIHKCLFRFDGVLHEVTLEYHSSGDLKQSPFRIEWRLLKLDPQLGDKALSRELLTALGEALRAYGYAGIRKQIPSTVVEFSY